MRRYVLALSAAALLAAAALGSAATKAEELRLQTYFYSLSPTSKRLVIENQGEVPITLVRIGGWAFDVKGLIAAKASWAPTPKCKLSRLPSVPKPKQWLRCATKLGSGARLTLDLRTSGASMDGRYDVNGDEKFPPLFATYDQKPPPAPYPPARKWRADLRLERTGPGGMTVRVENKGPRNVSAFAIEPQGFRFTSVRSVKSGARRIQGVTEEKVRVDAKGNLVGSEAGPAAGQQLTVETTTKGAGNEAHLEAEGGSKQVLWTTSGVAGSADITLKISVEQKQATVEGAPEYAIVSQLARITYKVTSNGPDAALGVSLDAAAFPLDWITISSVTAPEGECTRGGSTQFYCHFGGLAKGESAEAVVVARLGLEIRRGKKRESSRACKARNCTFKWEGVAEATNATFSIDKLDVKARQPAPK